MSAGNTPSQYGSSSRANLFPMLFGIVGVVLGVMLAKGLGSPEMARPKPPAEPSLQTTPQTPAVAPGTNQDSTEGTDPALDSARLDSLGFNPTDDEIWANTLGGDLSSEPSNPLGAAGPGTTYPPITGDLPGPGAPPVNPIVINGPDAEAELPQARFSDYVTIVGESEVSDTAAQLISAAKSAGASVQDSGEMELSKGGVARVLILAVDPKKAKVLEGEVARIGAGQKQDAWIGPYSERRYRMERSLRTQLEELEKLKSQLLIKYLDDAPAVVECTGRIAAINKQINALKPVPASRDVIRVYVGSKTI